MAYDQDMKWDMISSSCFPLGQKILKIHKCKLYKTFTPKILSQNDCIRM